MEVVAHVARWYVWCAAGARARLPPSPRVRACVLAAAHAHVVAVAIAAVAITALAGSELDARIIKGVLLSSVGPPCACLSLSVATDAGTAAMLLAFNYIVSLLASPVALLFLCGQAPIPALGPTISSALYITPPFLIGLLYTYTKSFRKCKSHEQKYIDTYHTQNAQYESTQFANNNTQIGEDVYNCAQCVCSGAQPARCMCVTYVAGLVLLYVDCCDRLKEAEGSLQIADVLGTLVLVVGYVCINAAFCRVYLYCGLDSETVRTLAICSVPKALHTGWEWSMSCVAGGLARLPAVFLAPAQALLLAALAHCPRPPA